MNFGSTGGALGEADPAMNRTLADFFTTVIQVFSALRYLFKGFFG